jgi:hypothetical protein
LRIDQEGMEREGIRLVALNNLIEKEKDYIVGNLKLRDHPIPPWKITNKKEKYKYIKPNLDFRIEKSVDDNGFYTTTKNIVLNNDLLTEKQMNDLQNIPLNKGGIITLNDYNYYNDDPRTLEEWQSLPISNYRFEIDNGLGGARDAFSKLLAHNKLTTEDRQNLLQVDGRLFNRFRRTTFPLKINKPKPIPISKPKSKSKYLIIHDEDENNNNVNIVHDNNLLTVNSPEAQESNDLFSKRRKGHRSSDDNIVINRKSNNARKIDNSDNSDNNDNSIIVASQDFTHLEIPVGNYFQPSITFCKSGTSYDNQRCLFGKDQNPICYLESSYLTNLLLDTLLETQKYFNECF